MLNQQCLNNTQPIVWILNWIDNESWMEIFGNHQKSLY